MSVESEILRIQRNVANTYAKVAEKGGNVPTQPNSANLAAAVASIPAGGGVPSGFIGLWSGVVNAIPSGWALCDGQNGTPDLRDRFVLGAGNTYAVGTTGGSETVALTVEQMPEHSHALSGTPDGMALFMEGYGDEGEQSTYGISSTKTRSTEKAGSSQPHPNMPPYYALAYIMKL